jgi:hypothetical protein
MTIEKTFERIATALESIAASLNAKNANPTPAPAIDQSVAAPVVVAPVAPNVVAAPIMPPAPVFAPAPIPAAPVMVTPTPEVSAAPVTAAAFPSKQAMTDFVIASYKALGPVTGAKIQQVLEGIGYKNINDVPEAQWGALKAGIEALKG